MELLKLATYNIRMETPDDKEDLWKNRKANVINIIENYDLDIIGLQEVKESQLRDLQKLKQYASFGLGRSEDDGNEYNSILYKKEKFDLIESDTFWLSETMQLEEKEKRWNADCPRICTWGKFQVRESGEEFYIFNTHFDHKSEEARYQSAKLIMDKLEALDCPVAVMGDLNGEPHERLYRIFAGNLRDAVRESKYHVGPLKTCTGTGFNHRLGWDEYHQIDYIFVNRYFNIHKTEVITDKFDGRYPSDHFPVLLHTSIGGSD
ncbi:endonuclease/exonuclease/phosphatase family protein [Oceanobacillus piezotolerans]|uniref:Endonuclease/exonuclease/phosphatase family protein n=1 Tax=Oceanobacillus piezotolerans TaxID=2448030 RepID=A0A498DKH2_9BACI|nr:endonuclease/exonuclease/phosphatase family protein [Oceanobacillus piezotolerans]RLL46982.1 endonuclease/exonuclease/phosphatase family protein [Oceanobacillus piezotolerans]